MTLILPTLDLTSEEETAALARRLSAFLEPGDTILLQGPIGAGKTHLARHLIQSILEVPEDVPSPTFTLVQVYDTRKGEVWHADLYRLNNPGEVVELGLADAFETAICLVEWPDRLGDLAPRNALTLTLEPLSETVRRATFSHASPRWQKILEGLT